MSDTIIQSPLNKATKDKFILVFDLPIALQKINRDDVADTNFVSRNSVQFSVYGNVIPDVTVPALEIRYAGSTLFNSSHSKDSFPPNQVNYTVDNEYKNYWTIYSWLNLLHDQKEGLFDVRDLITENIYPEYQTDISIFGLDEYDNRVIEWKFTKCFPTVLGGVTLSERDANEMESTFSFVYSQLHCSLVKKGS